MATTPDPTSNSVPGSGTTGGGGGGGGGGLQSVLSQGGGLQFVPWQGGGVTEPVVPGPPAIGIGINPPGNGPVANPEPGVDGPNGTPGSRLNSFESNVPGMTCCMPLATSSGRSSSATVGSCGEVFACGSTETWFPHRLRAVMC